MYLPRKLSVGCVLWCPDARSFRNFASDRAGRLFTVFFPATRMERTRHVLGKKKATRRNEPVRTVTKNSVWEMFCFNNSIRCFNTNFLAIISQSSQTYYFQPALGAVLKARSRCRDGASKTTKVFGPHSPGAARIESLCRPGSVPSYVSGFGGTLAITSPVP